MGGVRGVLRGSKLESLGGCIEFRVEDSPVGGQGKTFGVECSAVFLGNKSCTYFAGVVFHSE